MGRPENVKARKKVRDAAFELFKEVGYNKTSYAAVAQRCGMSRALVQYYFKKKQLFALQFTRMITEECIDELGLTSVPEDDPYRYYVDLVDLGTAYYERLIREYRQFTIDVLANRELSDILMAKKSDWVYEFVHEDHTVGVSDDAAKELVRAFGAFCEIIYWDLKNDLPIDVRSKMRTVAKAFAVAMGHSEEEAEVLVG